MNMVILLCSCACTRNLLKISFCHAPTWVTSRKDCVQSWSSKGPFIAACMIRSFSRGPWCCLWVLCVKLTLMTACCSLVHALFTTTCRVHYCAQTALCIRCTLLHSSSLSSLYYCMPCEQLCSDPVHFVDWFMQCTLLHAVLCCMQCALLCAALYCMQCALLFAVLCCMQCALLLAVLYCMRCELYCVVYSTACGVNYCCCIRAHVLYFWLYDSWFYSKVFLLDFNLYVFDSTFQRQGC